jgi:hypothetical protein
VKKVVFPQSHPTPKIQVAISLYMTEPLPNPFLTARVQSLGICTLDEFRELAAQCWGQAAAAEIQITVH